MQNRLIAQRQNNKIVKSMGLFAPAIALIGGLYAYPMFLTIYFSMTNKSLTGSAALSTEFVGFENFIYFYNDPGFHTIIINTIVFLTFSGIIGQQVFGFILAYMMKRRNATVRRIVGFLVVVGWVTPEIVAAYMFTAFFNDNGTLNLFLELLGIEGVSWLFEFPMLSVIIANIWKGTAYSMMMFQAALDSVSDDTVEAAKIDGANFWQVLKNVILPTIRGTIGTTFVLVTLGTLGAFGLIFAITAGGPGIQTTTLSIYMYQQAFSAYQIGYGMAVALVMLVFGAALSLLYMKFVKAND